MEIFNWGSTGIGREVALELARRGGIIIIASRHGAHGLSSVDFIRETSKNAKVFYMPLDLTNFNSIKSFASEFTSHFPRLDILINNAAVGATYDTETVDGYDVYLTTNYLGHFLLTYLLLDLLKRSAPSRIINTSSLAHSLVSGSLDMRIHDPGKGDAMYPHLSGYDISKLALVLHAKELTRRFSGIGVTANAVNPGPCLTNLWYQTGYWWPSIVAVAVRFFIRPVMQTPKLAAQTTIYCAVSQSLEAISGKYFEKCNIGRESNIARNADVAEDLWNISLLLTGCHRNGKVADILPEFCHVDDEEQNLRRMKQVPCVKNGKLLPTEAPDVFVAINRD